MPGCFSILRRIEFSDTDMAGIAHFSVFFRMMEEVEHAFLRELGLSVQMELNGTTIGWPRASAECEFFGPARFEDQIELRFRITRLGEKSMTYEVAFHRDEQRIALGKLTCICCAMGEERLRSIPIPPAIREKIETYLP